MKAKRAKARPALRRKRAKVVVHPESVAVPEARHDSEALDQPFAEGVRDELDPDLRHRLVSDAAFHRRAERGLSDDYDEEDRREAEDDVDHTIVDRPSDEK